jgi:hypothetical protein
MAGAKKSTLVFFSMLTFLGLLVPRKGGGYHTRYSPKNRFALFHVDVPGVFSAKESN